MQQHVALLITESGECGGRRLVASLGTFQDLRDLGIVAFLDDRANFVEVTRRHHHHDFVNERRQLHRSDGVLDDGLASNLDQLFGNAQANAGARASRQDHGNIAQSGHRLTLPCLIAPLAPLAPRGSRLAAAYFVVTPGRKACPLAPPQHGGARSVFDCSARYARSARIAPGSRLLRRHSGTKSIPSLLLSTAARDPCLFRWLPRQLPPTDARNSLLGCVGSRCRLKPEIASGRSGLNDPSPSL